MNLQLKSLIKAAINLGLTYDVLHKSGNLVRIKIGRSSYFFANHDTPFDRSISNLIMKDKDYTHSILEGKIRMPKYFSIMDLDAQEIYEEYKEYKNYNEFIQKVKEQFDFPVIIKRNRGSVGSNVFLCKDEKSVKDAIGEIFNKNSNHYDYVALVQEFIKKKKEYRVVCFNQKIDFMYEKNTDNASFQGNLSPFKFEGSKAILVKDQQVISKIEEFIKPIFSELEIIYCGLDILVDQNDELILLEVNSHPGFAHFISDNTDAIVIDLYKKMLLHLKSISN